MARKPISPQKAVEIQFEQFEKLFTNLMVDNKNWQKDIEEAPRTADFLRGPHQFRAEFLAEKIAQLKEFCVDMAVTPEEQDKLDSDEEPGPSPAP